MGENVRPVPPKHEAKAAVGVPLVLWRLRHSETFAQIGIYPLTQIGIYPLTSCRAWDTSNGRSS